MSLEAQITTPTTRRTVLKTGVKLAYAAPIVAASFSLGKRGAAACVGGVCTCPDGSPIPPCPGSLIPLAPGVCLGCRDETAPEPDAWPDSMESLVAALAAADDQTTIGDGIVCTPDPTFAAICGGVQCCFFNPCGGGGGETG
jgi:hypothetical protein